MNSTKTQSRTGKIARLPHDIRKQLNQRLLDNQPGSKICQWLNSLPETKAVCQDFAHQTGAKPLPINESHLSHWRRGGFQEWLRNQQTLEQTCQLVDSSIELARADYGDLTEASAVLLNAQVMRLLRDLSTLDWSAEIRSQLLGAPASRRQVESLAPASSPSTPNPRQPSIANPLSLLTTLTNLVCKLRSGDHNLMRLEQRRDMVSLQRDKYQNTQTVFAMKILADQRAKEIEARDQSDESYAEKIDIMGKHLWGDLWKPRTEAEKMGMEEDAWKEWKAKQNQAPAPSAPLEDAPGYQPWDVDEDPPADAAPCDPMSPNVTPCDQKPSLTDATPSTKPLATDSPIHQSINPSIQPSTPAAPSSSTASAGSPSTPDPRPSSPKYDPMSPNVTSCDQKPSPAPATPPSNPSRTAAVPGRSNANDQAGQSSSDAGTTSAPSPASAPPANTGDPENDPDPSEEPEEDAPAEDPWLAHLYHIARKQAEPGFLPWTTENPAIPPSPLNVSAEPNNKLPSGKGKLDKPGPISSPDPGGTCNPS